MSKMQHNLDLKIKNMLGNKQLIPEIGTKDFDFFGDTKLCKRTAQIYQLLCNISVFHISYETDSITSADSIRWLTTHLDIDTDLYLLPVTPISELYNNIKEYLWDEDNKDEETDTFFLFDDKYSEQQFLKSCQNIQKYSDILLLAQNNGFDIYQCSEILLSALFGNVTFLSQDRASEFERPILAAIIYFRLVSLKLIPDIYIFNDNPDNYE